MTSSIDIDPRSRFQSEIDDEYSNSSESSGPVDLSEGALRVFSDLEQPRRSGGGEQEAEKPGNQVTECLVTRRMMMMTPRLVQVIEVLVDGKIQIFEIQPVEAGSLGPGLGEESAIISYTAEAADTVAAYSSDTAAEYINLDTAHHHHQWQEGCSALEGGHYYTDMTPVPPPAPSHAPSHAHHSRYTGPIGGSHDAN